MAEKHVEPASKFSGIVSMETEEPVPVDGVPLACQQSPQNGELSSDPPKLRTNSTDAKTARPKPQPKLRKVEPAIALTGSMASRIVVVSAEEAKRQRDRAAHPEARPLRAPATRPTGRLAFEALFRDETEVPKASQG